MLLPALVAAASGYLALVAINGTTPLFPVHGSPPFSFVDLAGAARARARRRRRRAAVRGDAPPGQAHRRRSSTGRRASSRAALTIAALFAIGRGLTGESLVLTPGYGVVTWALRPSRSVALLLAVLVLRCLATGAAVAGGGVGGLFVPLVVAGALLGRAFGVAVGSTDSLFLVIGIAAFLGAGYRVPLAAIVFVAETTGRPGFVVPGPHRGGRRRAGDEPHVGHRVPGAAGAGHGRARRGRRRDDVGLSRAARRSLEREPVSSAALAIDSTIVPMWSKPSPTVLPIR